MNATKLVSELKNYGYDLYLEDENIRYRFHSLIEPPKERIEVLLDSLKRNKAEVIAYLRTKESPNKALSPHDAGGSIHKEAVYCSWIKKDVPATECYKPKGCSHRNEDDKPMECQYLKTFVRQRNRELGIQHGL